MMLSNWYKTASDDLLPSLTDDDVSEAIRDLEKDLVPEQPPKASPASTVQEPVQAPAVPSRTPRSPLPAGLIRRWEAFCTEMEESGDLEANPENDKITELAFDIALEAWQDDHPGEDIPEDIEEVHDVVEALEGHFWAWRNRRIEQARRRRR